MPNLLYNLERDENGSWGKIDMARSDITDLINDHGNILANFFNHISDMIFMMSVENDEIFRYVMLNPTAMREAGLSDDVYGKRIDEVYGREKATRLSTKYKEAVLARKPISFIEETHIIAESILTPLFNAEGVCTYVFSVTRDITERKKWEDQLQYLAYHDVLTGLPNRRLLADRMGQAIAHSTRYGRYFGILYVDCDHFKTINDSHGHDIGDEFLLSVTTRLKQCVRQVDTIARLGGDEFVIMLTSIEHPTEVETVAKRIIALLSQPWQLSSHSVESSVSIGISLFPHDGDTMEQLISRADKALYFAKSNGKNQYQFYVPAMG